MLFAVGLVLCGTILVVTTIEKFSSGGEYGPTDDVLTKPTEDRRELTLLRRVTERPFVPDFANVARPSPVAHRPT